MGRNSYIGAHTVYNTHNPSHITPAMYRSLLPKTLIFKNIKIKNIKKIEHKDNNWLSRKEIEQYTKNRKIKNFIRKCIKCMLENIDLPKIPDNISYLKSEIDIKGLKYWIENHIYYDECYEDACKEIKNERMALFTGDIIIRNKKSRTYK